MPSTVGRFAWSRRYYTNTLGGDPHIEVTLWQLDEVGNVIPIDDEFVFLDPKLLEDMEEIAKKSSDPFERLRATLTGEWRGAEVLADVNDRVSGQTQQLSNSVSWSKDIFEMRLAQDSLHLQIGMQLDSLERNFTRMVMVAEHLPEISDRMLAELNARATQLISTMDASVEHAFSDLDRQRTELQYYVSREREALVEQLRAAGDDLVRTTLDAVPGVIGQLLFYFVLAVAVLVGGPFALGFWLGGVRARARMKKRAGE